MALKLGESCLGHIFEFLTPVEWIEISQVCRSWRKVVLKQWKTIDEITYLMEALRDDKSNQNEQTAAVIPTKVAEKIVLYASPFVNVLKASSLDRNEKRKTVKFGPYWYKVNDFNADKILKLLAEKSTKITEFKCDMMPNLGSVKQLFRNNIVKKVQVFESYAFYKNIPTESIEDLDVRFISSDNFVSFKGYFPNLKKLSLAIDCVWSQDPAHILSATLPYTRGITSLDLFINLYKSHSESYKVLLDITKFKNLEELSIAIEEFEVKSMKSFLDQLVISCPKLRSVKLDGFEINKSALHLLMSLPKLENLEVENVSGFGAMNLPEMSNLSKCIILFSNPSTINMTGLCKAVKKMPKLLNLDIDGLSEQQTLKLVCEAAVVATSQWKDVEVRKGKRDKGSGKLKITRKNAGKTAGPSHGQNQTLTLQITDYDKKTFFDNVKAFVVKKMKQCEAFLLDEEVDSSDENCSDKEFSGEESLFSDDGSDESDSD